MVGRIAKENGEFGFAWSFCMVVGAWDLLFDGFG
jgi:hypothetical protein